MKRALKIIIGLVGASLIAIILFIGGCMGDKAKSDLKIRSNEETKISIYDNKIYKNILVFPNTTNGKIIVESLDLDFKSDGVLTILDEIGKVHFSKTISANTNIIDIDFNLSSGIYFLRYQNQNGLLTKKIKIL